MNAPPHGYVAPQERKGRRVDSRRVLVTGAGGSVAGQLLPGLDGRYDLRLTDLAATGEAADDPRLVVAELTAPGVLDELLDGVDAVVHLAGNPDPDAPWSQLRDPNVEAFASILAAARDHRVRRVVFASSVHAMGAHEGTRRWPIDPDWPPAPCCSYGATKAFDEALARVYAYRCPLSLVGLRFGHCAPTADDAEAVAGWLAPADLRRIVLGALEADVRFGVYHAVSWPSRRRWKLDATMRDLGYEPDPEVREPADDDAGADTLITCRREAGAP
jgi:nucleoside-diphosphate-sugar epimerase